MNKKHVDQNDHRLMSRYLNEIREKHGELFEESHLFKLIEMAQKGDKAAEQAIVENNLRLVIKIAYHYLFTGIPLMDLIEEGNCGLIEATRRFDTKKGFKFSTFATSWISKSIEHSIMNSYQMIRLPYHILRRLKEYRLAHKALSDDEHPDPSEQKIVKFLDEDPLKVIKLLSYQHHIESIDQPQSGEQKELEQTTDPTAKPEISMREQAEILRIESYLKSLTPIQRQVIILRYGLHNIPPQKLEDVGQAINLTIERVRQIEYQALKKLNYLFGGKPPHHK